MAARAANWILLGQTHGLGRMDRDYQADDSARKLAFIHPLWRHVQQRLGARPACFSEAGANRARHAPGRGEQLRCSGLM
jgi:hypothetical protein